MSKLHEILSGLVCLACFIIEYVRSGAGGIVYVLLHAIWPMLMIWFSDAIGSLTGMFIFGSIHPLSTETPGAVVRFFGWILLLGVLGLIIWNIRLVS